MAKNPPGTASPEETLEQLAHLVGSLQARTSPEPSGFQRDAGAGRKFARTSPSEDRSYQVYGVRDAKDALSKILNNASAGELSFIEAGRGGTVVVMSTNMLAGVISSFEEKRNLTFADALRLLPCRTDEMAKPRLRGQPPGRGLLRAAAARSRAGSEDSE